eukprot:Skav214305  [mRNA]  locus=scaffold4513:7866:17993:+ [translate_table: standard]
MFPNGWLGDELSYHERFGAETKWVHGSHYNVAMNDNVLISVNDGLNKYQGVLVIPENQLTTCCIHAGGCPHKCSREVTQQAAQLVEWTIDSSAIPAHEQDGFSCVLLERVRFQGVEIYTNVWDENTSTFSWKNAKGEKVSDDLHPTHLPIRSSSLSNHPSCGGSGSRSDLSFRGSGVIQSRSEECHAGQSNQGLHLQGRPSIHCDYTPMQVTVLKFHVDCAGSNVYPKATEAEKTEWSLIELFSGGLAGWKQAAGVLNRQNIRWESTHAVEIVPEIAENYCDTYRIEHVFDADHQACQGLFMAIDGDSILSTMFFGDVKDLTWIKCTPWQRKLLTAISAPCPPWSRASDRDGLHDPDGRLMIHSISSLRYLTPDVVTMENVDTFRQHKHFKCVLDTMRWAGFKLIWETTSDLRKLAPIARRRWYHHLIQYATLGEAKDIKICRCWQSKKFPYCDGSHKVLNEAGDIVGPFVVKVNAKPATTNVASNYLQARGQIPRTAAFFAMGFATVGLACAVGLGYVNGYRVHGKVGLPKSESDIASPTA